MQASQERGEAARVRDVVSRLTASWREHRFDDMTDLLDEAVVFENPGFGGRLEGRAPCVDSYRRFMATARVLDYVEHDMTVDTWGASAVARVHWEMAWEQGGQSHREAGHDVLVLTQRGDRWQIVWRTLVPLAG